MSIIIPEYKTGIDTAFGEDFSMVTICRSPTKFERLLRRLRLSKAVWEIKVIDSFRISK